MRLRSKKKDSLPASPVNYPVGTFVHSEKGYFYINSNNRRLRFTTKRVLESWRPHRIVKSTEKALAGYKITAKMKFREGSLLYSQATGKLYLISEHKARHIVNPDVLNLLGVTRKDAVWVSADEINLHEQGAVLN